MKKLLIVTVAAVTLSAGQAPAFAADMLLKAPPPPAPEYSWTGFYVGVTAGGGWDGPGDKVNYSGNDDTSQLLFAGKLALANQQPPATSYGLNQSGLVGGFEAGYNWQIGSGWLWGVETDFSFSSVNGQASGAPGVLTTVGATALPDSTNAQQNTDWYGTVRGRLGWLAQPNLLLFGTGGFAYGRVTDSANYSFSFPGESPGATTVHVLAPAADGSSFFCSNSVPCYIGSSSAIEIGWAIGGGVEWRVSEAISLKAEYQFIDLGTRILLVTETPGSAEPAPTGPSTFSAAFQDHIQVVRAGVNFHL